MRPRLIPVVLLLLAPFAAAGPASAQPALPLDRLLPEIRRTNPGQFLDAEGITRNGAPGYRLKWLTPDGRVIEREVDARTGRAMRDGGPPGFMRRPDGPPPERARAEGQANFDEAGGDDARPRFNRAFGPRPDGIPGRFGRAGAEDDTPRGPGPGFGGRRFGGARGDGAQNNGEGARGRRQDEDN